MALGLSIKDKDRGAPDPEALIARHGPVLLALARASIRHGLDRGEPLAVDPAAYPAALRDPAASFVTLRLDGDLRGCIGKARGQGPLVADVADNAFAAAFRDPRFEPLREDEFARTAISVSVLGAPEPIAAENEDALCAALRPGIDGLILKHPAGQALFLPAVWEMLPEPRDFVAHLKAKAGLDPRDWPPGLRAERFIAATATEESPARRRPS